MTNDDPRWYYDIGETRPEDAELPIGIDMPLTTRSDVESGEYAATFDLKIGEDELTGFETFTQQTVVGFIQKTDLSPNSLQDNLRKVQLEMTRAAQREEITIDSVDVQPSPRNPDDGEVKITIEAHANSEEYFTTFFIGPESAITSDS